MAMETKKCPFCEGEMGLNDARCSHCGSAFGNVPRLMGKRTVILALGVVILILAGAFLAYYFLLASAEDKENIFARKWFKKKKDIFAAVKEGNLRATRALLKENRDRVNQKDDEGNTPLHVAAAENRTDVAEILVKYKADVQIRNDEGWTPLHSAAANGSDKMAKFLIKHDADFNAKTDKGDTPLKLAIIKGHSETETILRKYGALVE